MFLVCMEVLSIFIFHAPLNLGLENYIQELKQSFHNEGERRACISINISVDGCLR